MVCSKKNKLYKKTNSINKIPFYKVNVAKEVMLRIPFYKSRHERKMCGQNQSFEEEKMRETFLKIRNELKENMDKYIRSILLQVRFQFVQIF